MISTTRRACVPRVWRRMAISPALSATAGAGSRRRIPGSRRAAIPPAQVLGAHRSNLWRHRPIPIRDLWLSWRRCVRLRRCRRIIPPARVVAACPPTTAPPSLMSPASSQVMASSPSEPIAEVVPTCTSASPLYRGHGARRAESFRGDRTDDRRHKLISRSTAAAPALSAKAHAFATLAVLYALRRRPARSASLRAFRLPYQRTPSTADGEPAVLSAVAGTRDAMAQRSPRSSLRSERLAERGDAGATIACSSLPRLARCAAMIGYSSMTRPRSPPTRSSGCACRPRSTPDRCMRASDSSFAGCSSSYGGRPLDACVGRRQTRRRWR